MARLSCNWQKIKAEYLRGDTSYTKLSKKYGVSFSSIRRRAEKEKWTDLRAQCIEKQGTKMVDAISENAASLGHDILSAADALVKQIIIGIQTGTLIVDAQSIKQLTGALKDLKEIKGFKCDADIREQEARIAKLIKDANTEEVDREIKVIISGSDLEEYSE